MRARSEITIGLVAALVFTVVILSQYQGHEKHHQGNERPQNPEAQEKTTTTVRYICYPREADLVAQTEGFNERNLTVYQSDHKDLYVCLPRVCALEQPREACINLGTCVYPFGPGIRVAALDADDGSRIFHVYQSPQGTLQICREREDCQDPYRNENEEFCVDWKTCRPLADTEIHGLGYMAGCQFEDAPEYIRNFIIREQARDAGSPP